MDLMNGNEDDYDLGWDAATMQPSDEQMKVSASAEDNEGYEDASPPPEPFSWWMRYHPNPASLQSSMEEYIDDDDDWISSHDSGSFDKDDAYRGDDDYEAAFEDDDEDDDDDERSIYESTTKIPAFLYPQLEQLDKTVAVPQYPTAPQRITHAQASPMMMETPHVPLFAVMSLLAVGVVAVVRGQQRKYHAKSSYGIRKAPPVQRDLGV